MRTFCMTCQVRSSARSCLLDLLGEATEIIMQYGCAKPRKGTSSKFALDYESGGQEVESLRVRYFFFS